MNMRQKIAWKHVVNQKGNIYLMDQDDKTYIVDFSKLNPKEKRHLNQMHLFHMIAIYAFPILLILFTTPLNPDLLSKLSMVSVSIIIILLIDYVILLQWVIPENIREILEEKKRR